jgi:hypothetical protein
MDKGGLTDHFRRAVRACLGLSGEPGDPPLIDRLALYRAEVKAASSDGQRLDVQPSDPRVPGEQNVSVRVGLPGAVAVVQPGAVVLLGWERGDPGRPYCVPSWESGAIVQKLVVNAQQLFLGAESGAEALVRKSEFEAHTHPPGSYVVGTSAVAGTSGTPASITGTTNVKAT